MKDTGFSPFISPGIINRALVPQGRFFGPDGLFPQPQSCRSKKTSGFIPCRTFPEHPLASIRLFFRLAALAFALPVTAQQPLNPSPSPPPPAPRFVVVLDAAHGGGDAGAHLDSGQLEKSVNLALNVRLRSLLAARGIQVMTTRESDASIDLDRRAEIANHASAAVCLSLHASENGSGVHLFASSLAPAQPTRFSAWKTAQSPWITRSLALAGAVNSALAHAGFRVTLGRIPLPGVESMTCPALAIEIGPQRDSDNAITAEPDNPDYQARVAASLAAAVLEWRSDPTRTEARQP